jgi:hypothetical protein
MGSATFLQTSFGGGAWSPYNYGRMDHPWYRKSMAVCENGLPLATGAWVRRPGTQLAAFTRNGAAAALIPFSFEDNQPYNIELTDGFLRYFQGAALATGSSADVSDISAAAPAVVTLSSDVDWETGQQVIFAFGDETAKASVPTIAGRVFAITRLSASTFSVSDPLTGLALDGALVGWVSGLSVRVDRILETVSPYTASQVPQVRGVQNETDMVLLQGDTYPQILAAASSGSGSTSFELSAADFVDGPYLDPETGGYVTPDQLTGVVKLTFTVTAYDAARAYATGDLAVSVNITYRSLVDQNVGNTPASSPTFWVVDAAVSALNSGDGFTEADIGRHIRLYSQPPAWVSATTYAAKDVVWFDNLPWVALTSITGAAEATGKINTNRPGVDSTKWAVAPKGALWTWGKIASIPVLSSLISQELAGSGTIGNLNNIAAAFDSDLSQPAPSAAGRQQQTIGNPDLYIGRSFSSGLAIASAKVYPTSDVGLGLLGSQAFTMRLRGKNTSPSSATDGTLLGSVAVTATSQFSPLTITLADQVTTWKYVWLDFSQLPVGPGPQLDEAIYLSELELYAPGVEVGTQANIQLYGDPLLYVSAITTWRLGLYNSRDRLYPKCGCYSEGRLWLAGSVKNRIDASKSNEFLVFSPTEADGSVPNNAAISYTFNSSDKNSIYWMIPDLQGIVAGTKGGEWLIESPSQATAGFAPTNIRARRVTKYGSANIEPQRTGLTTVFVQRYRRQTLEFLADAYSGKFVGPDMSELNRKAVAAGIAQIAYQTGLVPVIWNRLDDGKLSGATYRRTSLISTQPPDILGWHQHTLGHDRAIESICVGPSVDGLLDTLSMVTYDRDSGFRQVEVLTNIFDEDDDLYDARFVDGGIVPSSAATVSTSIRFYGLWALNGKTVTVWAAGLDCGDYVVTNGYLDVPLGAAGGLFTTRWLTQLSATGEDFADLAVAVDGGNQTIPAIIGFTYTSRGQVLRPVAQDATGAALGPAFAKIRRAAHAAALMHQSQGVSFGTSFDALRPALFRTKGDRPYSPTELYSDLFWGTIEDAYTFDSQFSWEVTRPYPLTITAIGGDLTTQN